MRNKIVPGRKKEIELDAEGAFLTEFAGISMTIIYLVLMVGWIRTAIKATIAAVKIIADRQANKDLRKQKSLVVMSWVYWTLGLVAATNHDPSSLTVFLLSFALSATAYINGRRLRKQEHDRRALAWINA